MGRQASEFPWTMGWYPTYRNEGAIYGKYIVGNIKDAKIAILYQNDDYGKDFVNGFKYGLGANASKLIVKEVTYEVSDPTVDFQIVTLKDSGANVFFSATTNKVAAQAIRKTYDIDWHPTQFLVNNASSIATVLTPAGLEKSVGIISTAYLKDPSDPQFANDPGIVWYREFMQNTTRRATSTIRRTRSGFRSPRLGCRFSNRPATISRAKIFASRQRTFTTLNFRCCFQALS